MKYILVLASIVLVTIKCSAYVIVDSNNFNGSFESGSIAPWSGGSVVNDAHFSVDGEWYAQTVALGDRGSIFLHFPAVSPDQLDFTLTFYVRTAEMGFSKAWGYLFARREDNSIFNASAIESIISSVRVEEWTHFHYQFRFHEPWDSSRTMSVGVSFDGGAPGSIGFVDAVTLTQIPEPNSFALFLAGAVGACIAIRIRSRTRHGR
jgi:hypothetical protein